MNKELFNQLKQDLIKHHIDCEGNACTSHPVFCVQTKKVIWGVDPDYSWDVQEVYDNNECCSYESVSEWIDDLEEEEQKPLMDYISERYDNSVEEIEEGCSIWDKSDLIDAINEYPDEDYEVSLAHGKTVYEDVDFLLTRATAEEYIENWSYKLNQPRIYVKSMWQNDYMRSFIKAIMEGEIVWEGNNVSNN